MVLTMVCLSNIHFSWQESSPHHPRYKAKPLGGGMLPTASRDLYKAIFSTIWPTYTIFFSGGGKDGTIFAKFPGGEQT